MNRITTKILALHSIQANMLGTEHDLESKVIRVLLGSGKVCKIIAFDTKQAREIDNLLNFYPSVGKENNSIELNDEFQLEIFE